MCTWHAYVCEMHISAVYVCSSHIILAQAVAKGYIWVNGPVAPSISVNVHDFCYDGGE